MVALHEPRLAAGASPRSPESRQRQANELVEPPESFSIGRGGPLERQTPEAGEIERAEAWGRAVGLPLVRGDRDEPSDAVAGGATQARIETRRVGNVMRWLKIGLAVNGVIFLWRGSLNILQPTSFYLEPDAPKYALDAMRVLGITYFSLGLIQLGTWWVPDRRAVRTVAGASLLFAAGVFAQAATQGSGSVDPFHQLSPGPAVENLVVAMLYAGFLIWDAHPQRSRGATHST